MPTSALRRRPPRACASRTLARRRSCGHGVIALRWFAPSGPASPARRRRRAERAAGVDAGKKSRGSAAPVRALVVEPSRVPSLDVRVLGRRCRCNDGGGAAARGVGAAPRCRTSRLSLEHGRGARTAASSPALPVTLATTVHRASVRTPASLPSRRRAVHAHHGRPGGVQWSPKARVRRSGRITRSLRWSTARRRDGRPRKIGCWRSGCDARVLG